MFLRLDCVIPSSKLRRDLCPGHAAAGSDPRRAEEMDRPPRKEDSQDPAVDIHKSLAAVHVHSLWTQPILPQEP